MAACAEPNSRFSAFWRGAVRVLGRRLGVASVVIGSTFGGGTTALAQQFTASEFGASPSLPPPEKSLLPTLHTAKAVGWPPGAKPRAMAGTVVSAYARGLDHPRWIYVLPNGDVLVAETEAPPKPDDGKGIRGQVQKKIMQRAGSGARPSANRITLLRGINADQSARERDVFLQGLNSPFGMALVGDSLYVADTDAVLRFPYHAGDTEIRVPPTKVLDLPAGTINHHWTKNVIASPDGHKLYVGIGSNSNAGENGLDVERERAAIWEVDLATGNHRVFASGLRNPNGFAWEPSSGTLWAAVNERDELGDHVPPDYMTGVREGGFYGWPFSYYGQHVDDRVKPQDPDLVAKAIPPQYALGAHTASLGLCWSGGAKLPPPLQNGMFVGQHGSWNRKTRSGYDVLFVAFDHATPKGLPIVVLSGFLNARGDAQGRPVGVAIDQRGALLVADDVGNTIWSVRSAVSP
jgi:glucose/arabinose dehydrogenase